MATTDKYALTDQVAFVTAGGAGIGRAIALTLAEAGADIVIADIDPIRCAEVEQRVRELGRACLAIPTDCGKSDQVRAAIEAAKVRFGRIDILVNNAGGVSRRDFLAQSENSWHRHIDLNLISMFAATQAVVPVMIAGGRGGSIINVSSIEGTRAAPGFAVYSACKAGMNNFTRTMALELGDHKIRVNVISPDVTLTPGILGLKGSMPDVSIADMPPARIEGTRRRIPLSRPGLDRECGNAALFLASGMSSYITGVILPVDGGAAASQGWVRTDAGDWTLIDISLLPL